MKELSKIKTVISRYYSKYEGYINPVLKLIFAFTVITILNSKLGYMKRIDNLAVTLVLSLICSFMPLVATTFAAGFVMLAHVYALGTGYALVFAVLLLLMLLVYLRFIPGETIVILITPVLFLMNFPYIVPLVMGIVGNPLSVISVGFGVVLAFMVTVLSGEGIESTGMVEDVKFLMESLLKNKAMLVTAGIFAIVLIIVYVIRRSPIKYARLIGISAGVVAEILFLLIGKSAVDIKFSTVGIIIGSIIAGVCCGILALLNYRLDYSKTENLQFEDNDYYYYVKAVPKINDTVPVKKAAGVDDLPARRRQQETERKPVSRVNTINSVNTERHNSQNKKVNDEPQRDIRSSAPAGRSMTRVAGDSEWRTTAASERRTTTASERRIPVDTERRTAAASERRTVGTAERRTPGASAPQSRIRGEGADNNIRRQSAGRSGIPDRGQK